jgi:hypothetical protein
VHLTYVATVLSCLMTSCFLGYDSRWGEAERHQRAQAARAAPSELRPTPDRDRKPLTRQRLRVYVSASYAAQIGDEQRRIEKLVEQANRVLAPTIGLALEMGELRRWPLEGDDLGAALIDLETRDAADGAGWVVGFVGRGPTVVTSFEQLGRARMHGRHFVLRAMNDAAEYDAIEQSFDELDDDERRALRKRRLDHKRTAVFLHEIGHTLGVPHEAGETALMHARYHHGAERFSDDAAALMRLTLAQRIGPESITPQALARSLVRRVESTPARWLADERMAYLAHLRSMTAPAAARPTDFDAARWRGMSEAERAAYRQAIEHERAGRPEEALRYAEALSDTHPDDVEVQDLRCRLALRIGGAPDALEAHCAAFKRLDGRARAR